jgi:hypothetical protein
MNEEAPLFSGTLSKGQAEGTADVMEDDEVGPPPFRSGPWASRIDVVMTADGLVLQLRLPPEQLRELADAAGDSDIVVHLVAEQEEVSSA